MPQVPAGSTERDPVERDERAHEEREPLAPGAQTTQTHPDAPTRPTAGGAEEWVSPGISLRKRWLTGLGVAGVAALFIGIALYENANMLVSTLIGAIFIGCFVWYLRIVAPTPFTLRLGAAGLARVERGGEPMDIPWTGIARVKEEVFKNGTAVSLTVYKRVGERGVHRAFVVYRDDVPRFDGLLATMRASLPEGVPWHRETVHE